MRPTTPPTTPPAMAPVFELLVPGVGAGGGVGVKGDTLQQTDVGEGGGGGGERGSQSASAHQGAVPSPLVRATSAPSPPPPLDSGPHTPDGPRQRQAQRGELRRQRPVGVGCRHAGANSLQARDG